jgi:hypothetical protein
MTAHKRTGVIYDEEHKNRIKVDKIEVIETLPEDDKMMEKVSQVLKTLRENRDMSNA